MADSSAVVEGTVKYRDGKKWKPRWCVVRKLSPVADCLTLQFYRDSKEKYKNGPTKSSLSLENFLGMETGFTLDKESNTVALVCSDVVVVLAFDSRELLIQWQVKIKSNVVEVQQYLVQISHIPPKSKLPTGPARLHLRDYNFSLVASIPPRLLGSWHIEDLRRYGVVDGKFCFEGGSKCGRDEGLHIVLSNQAGDISKAFDLASKGRLHGKRRPVSRAIDFSYGKKAAFNTIEVCSSRESVRPLLWNCDTSSTCDTCSMNGEDYLMHYCGANQKMFLSPQSRESIALSVDLASAHTSCVALSEMSSNFCSSEKVDDISDATSTRSRPYLVDRRLIVDRCPSCLALTVGGSHTADDLLDFSEDSTSIHTIIPSARKSSDRDSVMSGGSSSSSSDYTSHHPVDSTYDKPKRFSHLSERCMCMNKGAPSSPRSPMKSPLHRKSSGAINHFQYPEADKNMCLKLRHPCSCGIRQTNNAAISNENLSLTQRCAQRCYCKNKTDSLDRQFRLKRMPNHLISGRSSSPGSIRSPRSVRRGDLCPVVPKCDTVINNSGGITSIAKVSSTTNMPAGQLKKINNTSCTCTNTPSKPDPYANYAVPPSAVMFQCKNQTKGAGLKTPYELYDVPKQLLTPNVSAPQPNKDEKSADESISDDDKLLQQQHVCPCQKMMLWAENWLPCRRKDLNGTEEVIPICGSLGRKTASNKQLAISRCSCRLVNNGNPAEIAVRREARHRHPKDDSSGSEQSRVSVNSRESGYQSSESKETDNDSDIAKDGSKDLENYANIDFVDSLPLYENTSNVLMKAGIDVEDCAERPNLPAKSPGLTRKFPPLPPCDSNKGDIKNMKVCKCCCQSFPACGSDAPQKEDTNTEENKPDDENYLEMQPVMFEDPYTYADEQVMETLPLRPFMPYKISQMENEDQIDSPFANSHESSPMLSRRYIQKLSHRNGRSNSVAEIKRKTIPKKRSNSVDTLDGGNLTSYLSEDDDAGKKEFSKRKQSILSRFSFRRYKCRSSDELSPQGSNEHKHISRRIHHSVELLNVGIDEDTNSNNGNSFSPRQNAEDFPVAIKRSSSVPNKEAFLNTIRYNPLKSRKCQRIVYENYMDMNKFQSLPRNIHERRSPIEDGGKKNVGCDDCKENIS